MARLCDRLNIVLSREGGSRVPICLLLETWEVVRKYRGHSLWVECRRVLDMLYQRVGTLNVCRVVHLPAMS